MKIINETKFKLPEDFLEKKLRMINTGTLRFIAIQKKKDKSDLFGYFYPTKREIVVMINEDFRSSTFELPVKRTRKLDWSDKFLEKLYPFEDSESTIAYEYQYDQEFVKTPKEAIIFYLGHELFHFIYEGLKRDTEENAHKLGFKWLREFKGR